MIHRVPNIYWSSRMRIVDVIARKRDGHSLSREAIEAFVSGVTDGSVPDYQISTLLMAVVLRGMTPLEIGRAHV